MGVHFALTCTPRALNEGKTTERISALNSAGQVLLHGLMADLTGHTAMTEAHGGASAAKIVGKY
jgi:hypothetical protein